MLLNSGARLLESPKSENPGGLSKVALGKSGGELVVLYSEVFDDGDRMRLKASYFNSSSNRQYRATKEFFSAMLDI